MAIVHYAKTLPNEAVEPNMTTTNLTETDPQFIGIKDATDIDYRFFRQAKSLLSFSRLMYQRFLALESLDEATKQQSRRRARRLFVEASHFYTTHDNLAILFVIVSTAIMMSVPVVTSLAAIVASGNFSQYGSEVPRIGALIGFATLILVAVAQDLRILFLRKDILKSFMRLVFNIWVIYSLLQLIPLPLTFPVHLTTGIGVITVFIWYFLFRLILKSGVMVPVSFVRLAYPQFARALIVTDLTRLIYVLERGKGAWTDLQLINFSIRVLERVATTFEVQLPRTFDYQDASTRSEFCGTCQRIAAAIRQYKLWLLTPQGDTREILLLNLAELLKHATHGYWGELPQKDYSTIRERLSQRVITFLRRMFPVLLFFGIVEFMKQNLPLLLPASVADVITVLSLLYGLFVITDLIDPEFRTRISAFRGLREMLPL